MIGILTRLIQNSAGRVREEHLAKKPIKLPDKVSDINAAQRRRFEELVILGVLLRTVAHADEDFSEAEEKAIMAVLERKGLKEGEAAMAIAAAHEAAENRHDIQGFTREVNKRPYADRVHVLELLFEIAFADKGLNNVELESIRRIAKLMWVSHGDFIDAKFKVKAATS